MRTVFAVGVLSSSLILAACGGAQRGGSEGSQNEDHWETESELLFTYGERCGTGPFDVRFPARDIEWGRRLTVEVHGERQLPLHYSIHLEDTGGRSSESSGSYPDMPEENARCRTTESAMGATGGAGSSDAPEGSVVRAPVAGEPIAEGGTVVLAPPPALVPFQGELPGSMRNAVGLAYFPRGVPHRYSDEVHTWMYDSDLAGGSVVLRVWLIEPGDFDGLVLRFRDQTLVPDVPRAEYEAQFAAQLAAMDEHTAEYHESERVRLDALRARCDATPTASECDALESRPSQAPPPPLAETRPSAPAAQAGIDVDWIPGFWRWNARATEYVWVPGTFVVRPPPVVVEEVVVAPPPAAEPPPPPPAAEPPPPPRELTVEVAPPPAPRVETIPMPPRIPGVVWVAGRWELRGTAWAWIPGVWQLPPTPGARPIAPVIRERGGVRIYLPGGWLDVR